MNKLRKEYLERLKALQEEIVSSQDKIYSKVQPVSFVGLVYENGEKTALYFVKQPALLPEVLLITPNSPIGTAINGKKMWDDFTYEIEKNEKKISY